LKRSDEFRYSKLANILREQILSGFIKPGQFLLSENDLCAHYSLSRSSVRKALDQLHEEGLIIKKPGQGTIVSPDLSIQGEQRKSLHILTTSPSNYIDYCMPIILDAFHRQYPGIDVKLSRIPSSAIAETFASSREMGVSPDLLFISDPQYLAMLDSASFMDLQPALQQQQPDFYPELIRAFSSASKLLAAPVSFSPVFLVINPNLFERYGADIPSYEWTRDEFIATSKKLTRDTDGDGINDICGISLPLAFNRWPAIALRHGMRFRQDDNREDVERTLTFIHDILYRYRVATFSLHTREAFLQECAGMTLTTSFELASWLHADLPFTPEIAPLPVGDERSSLLIANAFMIPEHDGETDSDMAICFVQTALSREVQEEISRKTRFLSVLQSVNRQVWETSQLKLFGLDSSRTESHFLHELLSDSSVTARLDRQMELFWTGLESANSFADRYFDILSNP